MLERNEDSRPSFKKLAENLPTNIKNLPSTINLSVVGRTTEHVVKSSKYKTKILPPLGYSKSIAPVPKDQSERYMHQTSIAS
jgi:uroporphyrinogen-III synthase